MYTISRLLRKCSPLLLSYKALLEFCAANLSKVEGFRVQRF